MSIVCVTEVHAVVILERDDYNYFLPGLIAVCDGNKIKKNGYHGAPDLVAEVVSISSRSLDYIRKPVKYEQAGVREYWIVDPLRNVVMVYDFEAVGGGGGYMLRLYVGSGLPRFKTGSIIHYRLTNKYSGAMLDDNRELVKQAERK